MDPRIFQIEAEPVGLGDGCPPVGSGGKASERVLRRSAPEAEAKCEISVQF